MSDQNKCRVYYKPGGQLSIVYPVKKSKMPDPSNAKLMVFVTGDNGKIIPKGTEFVGITNKIQYVCNNSITIKKNKAIFEVTSLIKGSGGDLFDGDKLMLCNKIDGVESTAIVLSLKSGFGEVESEWLDRIYKKTEKECGFSGFEFDDINASELPQDRSTRDKWRGKKGEGIWVDKTIITHTDIEKELDAELLKDEPDTNKVIRLDRRLRKQDY